MWANIFVSCCYMEVANMTKTAVLVDSGCQIAPGSLDSEGIFSASLNVEMANESYRDLVDVTNEEVFLRMAKESLVVRTSQPATGDIIAQIQAIKAAGYTHVIAISIATGLSSTLSGMALAADMEQMPITLIDSKSTAANHRYLAFLAKRLIERDLPLEKIESILKEAVENAATFITTPNLDQLQRGGRITPAVAMLGKMLKIVPIMKLNHELGGKIDKYNQVRTAKKANRLIVDAMIEEGINNKDYLITIQHVLDPEMAHQMKEYLISKIGPCDNVEIALLPAVVGAHMGIGGIGYQYIKLVP